MSKRAWGKLLLIIVKIASLKNQINGGTVTQITQLINSGKY
jgi:hypothetical protein